VNWIVTTQLEQNKNEELPLDGLSTDEQQYVQITAEGLLSIFQGKGEEYLLDNEIAARDTILFIMRKYDVGLFASLSDAL